MHTQIRIKTQLIQMLELPQLPNYLLMAIKDYLAVTRDGQKKI